MLYRSSHPRLRAVLIQIPVQEVEYTPHQNGLPHQCWCTNLIFCPGIQALILKEINQCQATILSQTVHWKYAEILLEKIVYEKGVSNSSNECS